MTRHRSNRVASMASLITKQCRCGRIRPAMTARIKRQPKVNLLDQCCYSFGIGICYLITCFVGGVNGAWNRFPTTVAITQQEVCRKSACAGLIVTSTAITSDYLYLSFAEFNNVLGAGADGSRWLADLLTTASAGLKMRRWRWRRRRSCGVKWGNKLPIRNNRKCSPVSRHPSVYHLKYFISSFILLLLLLGSGKHLEKHNYLYWRRF